MMWDHDRLDAVLHEVCALAGEGDLAAAARRFEAFREGMRRHIQIEEVLLFPLFEERTGMVTGSTVQARTEHRAILVAIAEMTMALEAASPAEFFAARRAFMAVLPAHHAKEEMMMYPMIDEAHGDGERLALLAQLRAIDGGRSDLE